MYGTEKPFSYGDNFEKIDIPIHYFISMQDQLIRADDVLIHYQRLKKHHPELAKVKVFEGYGHTEFAYVAHPSMGKELAKTLKGIKSHSKNPQVDILANPFLTETTEDEFCF